MNRPPSGFIASFFSTIALLSVLGTSQAQQANGAGKQLDAAKAAFNEWQEAARKMLLADCAAALNALSAANRMHESVKWDEWSKASVKPLWGGGKGDSATVRSPARRSN